MKYLIIITSLIILLFTGCNSADDEAVTDIAYVQKNSFTGKVEKGPFLSGSSVEVYDLDGNLNETGSAFTTHTINDLGMFELENIQLSSGFVAINAQGLYFNERSGEESVGQISLQAISDILNKSNSNVNILTHLEKPRIEYLVKNVGVSFDIAKKQAQTEVLAIFNISNADFPLSESLDLSEAGRDNTNLLFVSAVILGFRTPMQLADLTDQITDDIMADGIINDPNIGSQLINHAWYLDPFTINTNTTFRFDIEAANTDYNAAPQLSLFDSLLSNFKERSIFPVTEQLIEYPDSLHIGNPGSQESYEYNANILAKHVTEIPTGDAYALASCQIDLRIKIVAVADNDFEYYPDSNQNWEIEYGLNNDGNYEMILTIINLNQPADLVLNFPSAGQFIIEYEEGNQLTPTIKTLTVIP